LFSLARENYLPSGLAKLNPRFHTPHRALIVGGIIGIIAIVSGKTNELIIFSVLGAIVMYIMSMVSLFVLRKKEPSLERPFKAPLYPYFPAVALLLSLVCLAAIIYYNPMLSVIFFALLIVLIILFVAFGKHKKGFTSVDH
jgi:ethanolamine permease